MGLLTKEPTVATSSGDEEDLDNDGDDDYSDKNDADYICKDDDSEDHGSGDDNCSDDYRCNDDDSNDDGDDMDNDGDGGATDNLCAICDNGGQLLCCEGQCKRSFHPRKKKWRDSNCETLGLTSAQLQEIAHYLCKNCEYKQHQCFSCGDLAPSDGPNAKVFQCYKASCGHFYHPSCIAKLLEPDDTDGARELEKRIAAGMPFTCPVHWCSECRTMEDDTKKSLRLAPCRRCPVSYHKKCLPRRISFEKKRGSSVRAWFLGDRIIIYCRRHKLEATLGAPRRDHIKLPSSTKMDTVGAHCMDQIKLSSTPEIDKTRDLATKKRKVTGKRKMNTDQGSTGTAELSNKVCPEEVDQNQTVDMNNLREGIIPEGRGVLEKETIRLNQAHNDELEKLIVEEQAEEDENNTKSGKERENRRRENAYGETTCDRTRDLAKKKRKVTGRRKMKTDQGSTGTAELSNKVCREEADQDQTVYMNTIRNDIIPKGRGFLEKEAIRLSQAQNDELEKLIVEEQAEEDENNTKSGKERETCRRENAYVEKEKTPGNKSNKFGLTNGQFTSGSNGDREIDGSYAFQKELKSPQWNDNHRATGIDTSSDKSRKRQRQEEQATDGNMLDLESNKNKFHMETGRDARQSPQHLHNHKKSDARQSPQRLHNHKKPGARQSSCCSSSKNHPWRNDDQRSSMTFEYKSREGRGSSREEWRNNLRENSYRGQSPLGRRNPQNRSKRHSLEESRIELRNSNPRSNNQHRYEQHRHDDDGGKRRRSCPEDYASDVDIAGRRPHRHEDYCTDVDIGGRRPSRQEDYYSDGDRRRSSHRDDYSSDGDIGGRRLSPQQSALPPDNFGTRLSPPLYPRTEYGANRSDGSPPYQRGPERVTSARRGPYLNPRGSDHADYEMERRKIPFHHNPPNAEYDGYTDLEYCGHHEMDVAPSERYSLREDSLGAYGPETDAGMGEEATFRGGRFSDRGARSDHSRRNRMNSEDRAFAVGSVTDRYVPRLDRTNHTVRGDYDQPDYPLW